MSGTDLVDYESDSETQSTIVPDQLRTGIEAYNECRLGLAGYERKDIIYL